jgi:hypothetical protein
MTIFITPLCETLRQTLCHSVVKLNHSCTEFHTEAHSAVQEFNNFP